MSIFDKLIQQEIDRHHSELAALDAARNLVNVYGLAAVVPYVEDVFTFRDYFNTPGGRTPANRYWVTLTIDAQYKDEIRSTALDAFPAWEKRYHVDTYERLLEEWVASFDEIHHDVTDRYRLTAQHKIILRFHRPAVAGERITDTCTVSRESYRGADATHLTITCSRED
jgi:hypothetical protein